MSKKAEERAREAYPFSEGKVQSSFGTISFDQHHDEREGFIKGYEQAEKDLALTWKDVADIVILADTILDGNEEEWRKRGAQAYYEAVLKAFNAQRNEKEI